MHKLYNLGFPWPNINAISNRIKFKKIKIDIRQKITIYPEKLR